MRKRHIGNDIVTIVFQEPGSVAFTPEAITSQFQHVFIIVKAHNPNTEKVAYRYADCNFTKYIILLLDLYIVPTAMEKVFNNVTTSIY